jgi:hypothetical protein
LFVPIFVVVLCRDWLAEKLKNAIKHEYDRDWNRIKRS